MRLLVLAEAMQRNGIARARMATRQSPWLAFHAVHLRTESNIVPRLDDLFGTKSATEPPCSAGILPQRVALDQQWVLRLDLFGRAVMRIAIVDRDGGAHAVAVVLGAPAAANQAASIDVECIVLRFAAIDACHDEIGVMAGDNLLWQRRSKRLKDGVDDRHGIGHPHSHRSGLYRAYDAAGRQHDIERAKLTVVDGHI